MNTLTITWIALPLFIGFLIFLLPQLDRYLVLITLITSTIYGLEILIANLEFPLTLLDNFGVTLLVDQLSGYFILTNALVMLSVLIYCWQKEKHDFFYGQMIILHGSLNAIFVCADLMSLYVALEVSGIAAFLLMIYPRHDRAIWVGLRYLFVSNTAMLFYLVGAVLVYQSNHSFSFTGLNGASPEVIALIFMGLLSKGGIFVSGFWLPLTHSESETPVSALLSGIVVKASVFSLVRCALIVPELSPLVQLAGLATALFGIGFAMFANDTKRLLAFSTISQLGGILVSPAVGGFYALTHGLAKSGLFLITGSLPSRNFQELEKTAINTRLWVVLVIIITSVCGLPLLAGYEAKTLMLKTLLPWQGNIMTVVAVGTVICLAKFVFIPHNFTATPPIVKPNLSFALVFLVASLTLANMVYDQAYNLPDMTKAIAVAVIGWLIYYLIKPYLNRELPRQLEQLEHLIGFMTLVSILLFWAVLA